MYINIVKVNEITGDNFLYVINLIRKNSKDFTTISENIQNENVQLISDVYICIILIPRYFQLYQLIFSKFLSF